MIKEYQGKEDHPKFQNEQKPTNLAARLEEARALRKIILAQREQGLEGASNNSDPEKGSDGSDMLINDKLNSHSETTSNTDHEHEDSPAPETLKPANVKRGRITPPLQDDRQGGRVAERLALGLGLGLGIGASLYLGAFLSGSRIGFVAAESPILANQPQQTALHLIPIETNEIVSPTYVSLVEPKPVTTITPSENDQSAESSLSVQPIAVISNYEMAREDANLNFLLQIKESPDDAAPAPAIRASKASDQQNFTPSLLPISLELAPSEALDTRSVPAPVPDRGMVKELITDPAASVSAKADAPAEPGIETMTPLAEPDQRLLGAEAYTVVLNAPSTLSDNEIASVAKDIVEMGATLAKVDKVNFRISATQIRFFHPEDAESVATIAERMGAEARDFTSFRPSPPAGTIEMFLAGGGRLAGTQKAQLEIEKAEQTKRVVRRYPTNDNR